MDFDCEIILKSFEEVCAPVEDQVEIVLNDAVWNPDVDGICNAMR